jgi:type VI secretion system protein ImpK
MRESLANLVHPVLLHGLRLQERLARGELPEIEQEQAALGDLLLIEPATAGRGGVRDVARDQSVDIRYALVSWLDELFTGDSVWGSRWNERKLEVRLYDTNDRAWKFWQQARQAQSLADSDALEVFFLCVMLGFRGELRDDPAKLQAWVSAAKLRLGKVQELEWPNASDLEPPTRVPPLRGRDRLRRMVLTGWLTLLALVPVMAFWLVRRLGEG